MARMIEQLLDLTRTRHGGGIPIDPRPVDLAEVARRIVDELEIAYPEHTLNLTVDARAQTIGEWDPDRLAQVVSNLVGNAIHHGRVDHPIEVCIGDDGNAVTLVVHNMGEPIPAHYLPVIFDPFQGTKGARRKGLGLGLFITKQILLAHGGQIDVESNPTRGTTFTVRLPRTQKPTPTEIVGSPSDKKLPASA
jgi:signal transduction histidine kinase